MKQAVSMQGTGCNSLGFPQMPHFLFLLFRRNPEHLSGMRQCWLTAFRLWVEYFSAIIKR